MAEPINQNPEEVSTPPQPSTSIEGTNKHIAIIIGVLIIGIAIIIAGAMLLTGKDTQELAPLNPTPVQTNKAIISYKGNWVAIETQKDYYRSYSGQIPANWTYLSGGDTDTSSAAQIIPVGENIEMPDAAYVNVIDYRPVGCPSGKYIDCSLDQIKIISAEEHYKQLITHLNEFGEVSGYDKLQKLVSNVYTGNYHGQPAELYVKRSLKGVIAIAFHNPERFDSVLKSELLAKINLTDGTITNGPSLPDDETSLPASTGAAEGFPTDITEAEKALTQFFMLLNQRSYKSAIGYYGGGYEQLRDWNPETDPANKEALFKNGCEANGLNCLKVKQILKAERLAVDKFEFKVQFAKSDGSTFSRGPCCGASETDMPTVTDFTYTVSKVNNKFYVMGMPPYTP